MIQQLSVHVKDSFFFYIAASLDFYTLRFCQISLPLAHPSNAINSVQTRYKLPDFTQRKSFQESEECGGRYY